MSRVGACVCKYSCKWMFLSWLLRACADTVCHSLFLCVGGVRQGFSWAILSREATNNEANSIAKADTFYADWRVGQGGAGGGLSTVEAYSGAGYCGAMTYAQTDLQHFQAWVGTLASATSGSVPRTITGYYDGNSLNWQARWSYCYNTLYGSVSSTQSVSIGTAGYSGDIMEIIVWKGVALKCVLRKILLCVRA